MRVLLHTNQLGIGGTSVTLWDYAIGCETLLGHEVFIATMEIPPNNGSPGFGHHPDVVKKFQDRFPVLRYNSIGKLNQVVKENRIDVGYFAKSGEDDGVVLRYAKTVIHVIFPVWEPHGHVYAFVSPWLSQAMTKGNSPWVPHIINELPATGNLRDRLEIPKDAIVFGGYGRSTSFDIPFVRETIVKIASSHPEIYFLFNSFSPFGPRLKNLIFLPESAELDKAGIIDTCDAMMHGRARGETFGIAVAEWSLRNRPVITYANSPEKAHIDFLGDSALLYRDSAELEQTLLNFRREPNKDWNKYREFTAEKVMRKFQQVFLS